MQKFDPLLGLILYRKPVAGISAEANSLSASGHSGRFFFPPRYLSARYQ